MSSALLRMPFEPGCMQWLKDNLGHLSEKTAHEYKLNIEWMSKRLGKYILGKINADHLQWYGNERATDLTKRGVPVGAPTIRHECGLVCKIRKDLKKPIEGYKPRPRNRKKIGSALTDRQRATVLEEARENVRGESASLFLKFSLNTAAGPKETFGIQLQDLHLEDLGEDELPWVRINGTKNENRIRRNELNKEAYEAVLQALERAKRLGAYAPEHYLFPKMDRKTKQYDVTKPQTTCKTAWNRMKDAAGLPKFRPYDCRHHFITHTLEQGDISPEALEEYVGHIDPQTKKFYSHFRVKARQKIADAQLRKQVPRSVRERGDNPIQNQNDDGALNRAEEKLLGAMFKVFERLNKKLSEPS